MAELADEVEAELSLACKVVVSRDVQLCWTETRTRHRILISSFARNAAR
jgi:hypothetical protein